MPYAIRAIKYTREEDGRVRLTDEQRESIRAKYKSGNWSMRSLAGRYKVDRRLIQFTVYPERYFKLLKARKKAKVHLKYYDKDKRRIIQRKYRAKKKRMNKQPLKS